MTHHDTHNLDMHRLLDTLAGVLDQETADSEIGRILMPGPTYLGTWARDTGVACLGLNRLGKTELSEELLRRYWSYQITADSDPDAFIFRNKTHAGWTEADAFRPTREQLLAEAGAFPTSVYIRTPDFPPGTREIYARRADLDSACWLIIALADHHAVTGEDRLVRDLAPQVARAIAYLCSRDDNGDHLLEQGPNEDWADILLRHGTVSYTQAVWFRALESAAVIFDAAGDGERAGACRMEREDVRRAINDTLMTPHGYYADYVTGDRVSLRRSLDTALLVAFGACEREAGRQVLEMLDTLDGPFGCAVVEPGYAPADIGPSKYQPGQYHNEGIWPWITSYYALAWARIGEHRHAHEVICSVFRTQPHTIHEWIDGLNGQAHHPNFATAAGALAWAIVESGLAA